MREVHKPLVDRRMRRRLVVHHLPLAAASLGLTLFLSAVVASPDVNTRLSMATAYVGLLLLGLTLFTGPLNVLRGRPNPVSADLRRDLGVWAAIIGIAHVGLGLQVHMGNPWLYFFPEPDARIPRTDAFGWANWIGLGATLLLLLLLALSNDYTLRKLGRTRWKALQRLNYLLAGAVAVHGLLYQVLENRTPDWVVLFGGLIAFFAVVQVAGLIARLRTRGRTAGRTAGRVA